MANKDVIIHKWNILLHSNEPLYLLHASAMTMDHFPFTYILHAPDVLQEQEMLPLVSARVHPMCRYKARLDRLFSCLCCFICYSFSSSPSLLTIIALVSLDYILLIALLDFI